MALEFLVSILLSLCHAAASAEIPNTHYCIQLYTSFRIQTWVLMLLPHWAVFAAPVLTFEALLGSNFKYFQLWKVCLSEGNLEIVDSTTNLLKKVHYVFLKDRACL